MKFREDVLRVQAPPGQSLASRPVASLAVIGQVLEGVKRSWYKWLRRRGQRRPINWERFAKYLKRFPLPAPRICVSIWARAP